MIVLYVIGDSRGGEGENRCMVAVTSTEALEHVVLLIKVIFC